MEASPAYQAYIARLRSEEGRDPATGRRLWVKLDLDTKSRNEKVSFAKFGHRAMGSIRLGSKGGYTTFLDAEEAGGELSRCGHGCLRFCFKKHPVLNKSIVAAITPTLDAFRDLCDLLNTKTGGEWHELRSEALEHLDKIWTRLAPFEDTASHDGEKKILVGGFPKHCKHVVDKLTKNVFKLKGQKITTLEEQSSHVLHMVTGGFHQWLSVATRIDPELIKNKATPEQQAALLPQWRTLIGKLTCTVRLAFAGLDFKHESVVPPRCRGRIVIDIAPFVGFPIPIDVEPILRAQDAKEAKNKRMSSSGPSKASSKRQRKKERNRAALTKSEKASEQGSSPLASSNTDVKREADLESEGKSSKTTDESPTTPDTPITSDGSHKSSPVPGKGETEHSGHKSTSSVNKYSLSAHLVSPPIPDRSSRLELLDLEMIAEALRNRRKLGL